MSIGPVGDATKVSEVAALYARTNCGLIDAFTSAAFEPDMRWPRTLRGWLGLVRDSFITDVLRRCARQGCWHHATGRTMFSGRLCQDHWLEYYTDADDTAEVK